MISKYLLVYLLIGVSYIAIDWVFHKREMSNFSPIYLLFTRFIAVILWPFFLVMEWLDMIKKFGENKDDN